MIEPVTLEGFKLHRSTKLDQITEDEALRPASNRGTCPGLQAMVPVEALNLAHET